MKEIIDKVGSYNIFNFLLPGVIFVAFINYLTPYRLTIDNLITGAFIYYFIGLIVSRFGSLAIEPVLKKIHFIEYSRYDSFVTSSRKDKKIAVLVESNNMYRTFVALFTLLIFIKIYSYIARRLTFLNSNIFLIAVIVLLLGFLLSYRKQTVFINKRVKHEN